MPWVLLRLRYLRAVAVAFAVFGAATHAPVAAAEAAAAVAGRQGGCTSGLHAGNGLPLATGTPSPCAFPADDVVVRGSGGAGGDGHGGGSTGGGPSAKQDLLDMVQPLRPLSGRPESLPVPTQLRRLLDGAAGAGAAGPADDSAANQGAAALVAQATAEQVGACVASYPAGR